MPEEKLIADDIARQDDAPFRPPERQELRWMIQAERFRRRQKRNLTKWGRWIGVTIGSALVVSQLMDSFWRLLKLIGGRQ